MPKRGSRGRFVKGGHKSMVRYKTRTIHKTRYRTRGHKRHHRRRGGRGGGSMNLTHLAIAGAGLAYLTSSAGPSFVTTNVAKVPGAKTFGPAATAGLVCLGIDRFVKRNKWLRAAGVIGVVLAAAKVGEQGTAFKWLGDESGADEFSGDIEGDDE